MLFGGGWGVMAVEGDENLRLWHLFVFFLSRDEETRLICNEVCGFFLLATDLVLWERSGMPVFV